MKVMDFDHTIRKASYVFVLHQKEGQRMCKKIMKIVGVLCGMYAVYAAATGVLKLLGGKAVSQTFEDDFLVDTYYGDKDSESIDRVALI